MANPRMQQRETQQGRRYKAWQSLSACVLVFAATITVVRTMQSSTNNRQETIEECIKNTGATFDVDPEINPCDDFYKFACNKWIMQNPGPTWTPKWSIDDFADERLTKTVIDILESSGKDVDLVVISQAKDLFQKCLKNHGDHPMSDAQFVLDMWKYLTDVYGRPFVAGGTTPLRKQLCGAIVFKYFQFALLHKMLEHNYKDKRELMKIQAEVQFIFNNIKDAFQKEKSHSFLKVNADTQLCVGYPQWIFSPIRVQTGYNWLKLNNNQTLMEQMVYIASSDGDLFDERFHDFECHMWYWKSENTKPKTYIEQYIPMRSLEFPFFDLNRPKAINYGSLGILLASTMAISYIDWQVSTPANCLEKQYGLFTVDLGNDYMSINGKQTLRDNFVDNVALQLAFKGFLKTNHNGNKNLENEDASSCKNKSPNQFTNDQLFFLGYAQSWCETLSKEELKLAMRQSPSSPSMFKVMGSLQNFKEFAKAWKCPLGSNMNPREGERCKVL